MSHHREPSLKEKEVADILKAEIVTIVRSGSRVALLPLMLCVAVLSFAGTTPRGPDGQNLDKQIGSATTIPVHTSGWHIFVDGERFIIKGICYNPVPVGSTSRSWDTLDEDIELMHDAGINTIRTYSPIVESGVLDKFAAAGIKVIMGITANSGTYNIQNGGYLTYINTFKNHDAILLWELGNEYNYHPEWFGGDVNNWYAMLENAARQIHLIDSDHPVSTAHGELPSVEILAMAPSVDVWGMNSYRWDQSHTAITDFAAISDKPCYLSETGGDSYNTAPSHPTYSSGANEQMQADANQVIVNNVFANLDVGSGVVFFEFSDEWWKAGNPATQEPGGSAPHSSGVPYDGAPNEEHWGIVEVSRTTKMSFDIVKAIYTGPVCLVSAHAGPDRFLPVRTTSTTLDGSASSHTGPLKYVWSQTGGPTTASFPSTSATQPKVTNLSAGDYTFSVTVTGGCGSSTDAVEVTVTETENVAPVANSGPDQTLPAGTTSTALDGSGSHDSDGGPATLSYSWTQTAGPALNLSSPTELSPLVSGISDSESYTFQLVVFDGLDSSKPSSVTLYGDAVSVNGFESGDTTDGSMMRSEDTSRTRQEERQ